LVPDADDPRNRSHERLRFHYEVERELADRLRNATREQRTTLYSEVYDELFRRVSDHPQLVGKSDPSVRAAWVQSEVALLRRYTPPRGAFLEIGAGDCALSFAMAAHAERVYAVDVSAEIARGDETPSNFELVLSDGREIPVPPASISLAYSNQLMEHLHPDDASEQLNNIAAALVPGGAYVCVTPNRLSGPHDISSLFDEVPRGFHLHEYTTGELRSLMLASGFRRVTTLARVKRFGVELSATPVIAVERALERLPPGGRRRGARLPLVRNALDAVIAYR
jgi:SAM-dependent methyltransferase